MIFPSLEWSYHWCIDESRSITWTESDRMGIHGFYSIRMVCTILMVSSLNELMINRLKVGISLYLLGRTNNRCFSRCRCLLVSIPQGNFSLFSRSLHFKDRKVRQSLIRDSVCIERKRVNYEHESTANSNRHFRLFERREKRIVP